MADLAGVNAKGPTLHLSVVADQITSRQTNRNRQTDRTDRQTDRQKRPKTKQKNKKKTQMKVSETETLKHKTQKTKPTTVGRLNDLRIPTAPSLG